MRHLISIFLASALVLALSGCGGKPAAAEFYAMDTVMSLTAYGKGADAAIADSESELLRLEKLLSRTDGDSAVSAINAHAGSITQVDTEVAQLVEASVEFSTATGGAFDITVAPVVLAWGFTTDTQQIPTQEALQTAMAAVGSERIVYEQEPACYSPLSYLTLGAGQSVDLGGIAKGYASDCLEAIYAEAGIDSGIVRLGGNIYVRGVKPDGSLWRVAVQDPGDASAYAGILKLSDAFAVTSGGYQRYFEQNGKIYHHIIDPATGYPADSGLRSVTIVAPGNDATAIPLLETGAEQGVLPGNGAMCDAFSTALFVMGEDKAIDFWRSGGFEFDMVLITDDNRVLTTAGIADQFEQAEGTEYTYEIIR